MAKKVSTETMLARLAGLTEEAVSETDIQELRQALHSANSIIVAKAAQVAARCRLSVLLPELAAAYAEWLEKPAKADKRCLAKTALIEALNHLEEHDSSIFLRGIRYVQLEPIYGGHEDTAVNLRAACAFALARLEDPQVFFELTTLLTDSEPHPRMAAVKALTYLNEEKSELLLRLKCLTGDSEPQIVNECLAGLMSITPERSLPFVAGFLSSADPILAEGAALALGESRKVEAFHALRAHWDNTIEQPVKIMLLLPMSLVRCDEAFHFLLNVVRQEYREYAAAAIKALHVYRDDLPRRQQIQQAVAERDERHIADVYREVFDA